VSTDDRHDCANDAGAYVLGALEPAEARAFVEHMETCTICRDEVEALRSVVDALPMSATQHKAPRGLRRRIMRAARTTAKDDLTGTTARRSPRWGPLPVTLARPVLAGALGLVLALAVIGGIELSSSGTSARVIRASVGHAELRLSGGHGTLVVDRLAPAPTGDIYEMWLAHDSGEISPSTLFGVTSQGTAVVGVPGGLEGVSRVMVTAEPAGGTQTPTTPALIVARLPE
jgi:anti-sigma-K factor RskA